MKGLHPFNPLRQSHSHWDARRPASLTRQADSPPDTCEWLAKLLQELGRSPAQHTYRDTNTITLFSHPRCTAERTHNPVSTSGTKEEERWEDQGSVSCGRSKQNQRDNTHRKMGHPVKNLRATDHIPLNHFQLDHQGVPLFPIFCIQLQKDALWRPKKSKTKLQKTSRRAGLYPRAFWNSDLT